MLPLFGFVPTKELPTWAYNSILGTIGAACYADTFWQFLGLTLMLEALLVSIERSWPKNERPL